MALFYVYHIQSMTSLGGDFLMFHLQQKTKASISTPYSRLGMKGARVTRVEAALNSGCARLCG